MYDKMKQTDNKLLYDTMHSWISVSNNIYLTINKKCNFYLLILEKYQCGNNKMSSVCAGIGYCYCYFMPK